LDSIFEADSSTNQQLPAPDKLWRAVFSCLTDLFCLRRHEITSSPSERHSRRILHCRRWTSAPLSASLPLTMHRSRHGYRSTAALRRPRRFPESPPSTPVLLKLPTRAHGDSCRPPAPIPRYLIEYRRRAHWEASGLWHFFRHKVRRTCPGSTEQPWSRSLYTQSPRLGDCVSSRLCGLHRRLASGECSRSTLFAASGLLFSSTTTWSRCFRTMDILHIQVVPPPVGKRSQLPGQRTSSKRSAGHHFDIAAACPRGRHLHHWSTSAASAIIEYRSSRHPHGHQLDQFLASGLIPPWPHRIYRPHPRAVRASAQVQPRVAPIQGSTRRN